MEFTEKGFASARMDDVAARAGVAKGTIYLNFPDKQQLFAAIVRDAMTPVLEVLLTEERQVGETAGAFLRRIVPDLAARLASPPRGDVLRLLISEGPRFPDLAELYYQEVVSRAIARVRELAAEATAAGEHDGRLERFPQLLVAPALLSVIWQALFAGFEPLNLQGLMRSQLDLLLPPGREGET